jgi:dolichol-phosphate mannosyltransferase
MVDVSIILPTYNEKESISEVLLNIVKVLEQHHLDGEILVVDDNSPDQTAGLVRQLAQQHSLIKLIVRHQNHGLGLSIKDGIQAAQGQIIVGMDADYNHDPVIIPQLIASLKTADLAVASRFIRGGGMADKKRYYLTFIYNVFLKSLGFPTMDNMSGYYAVKKDQLVRLGLDKIYYGYGDYHLRLVWLAKKAGMKIKEIPTFYHQRWGGKSKSNLPVMLFNYTRIALRLFINQEK